MHPGGANFSFCDGSVRSIKDTVSSWPIDPNTCDAVGITYGSNASGSFYQIGTARPGVFQCFSQRQRGHQLRLLLSPPTL